MAAAELPAALTRTVKHSSNNNQLTTLTRYCGI